MTSTTAVRTSQPRAASARGDLVEPLGVDVGERDPRAAVGQHLGDREAEPARRAGHERAAAADVEESAHHRGRIDAHPACTSAFITSAGCSIANSIAAGASSSANSCEISGSTASRRRATSSTASAKSSAAAAADAEHVELAERQRADAQRHLVGREADDDDAPRLRDDVERGAHRLLRAGRLDHDLGQLAACPLARARDEIVVGLEQREVGARRATALEPAGEAVGEQHARRRGRARRSPRPGRSGRRRARARALRPPPGRADRRARRSTSAR